MNDKVAEIGEKVDREVAGTYTVQGRDLMKRVLAKEDRFSQFPFPIDVLILRKIPTRSDWMKGAKGGGKGKDNMDLS